MGHLRTHDGDREVDLVVVRDDGKALAIEVKIAATIDDKGTRHLRWGRRAHGRYFVGRHRDQYRTNCLPPTRWDWRCVSESPRTLNSQYHSGVARRWRFRNHARV